MKPCSKVKVALSAALLAFVTASPETIAQVYKCKDATGKLVYSDRPCETKTDPVKKLEGGQFGAKREPRQTISVERIRGAEKYFVSIMRKEPDIKTLLLWFAIWEAREDLYSRMSVNSLRLDLDPIEKLNREIALTPVSYCFVTAKTIVMSGIERYAAFLREHIHLYRNSVRSFNGRYIISTTRDEAIVAVHDSCAGDGKR